MDKISDIYNFCPIEDTISTSGQPTVAQFRALAEANYEAIINLALHNDPRYSLADEKGLVEGLGMAYIHIPVLFDTPTEDDLSAFFCAMEQHHYKMILIHCAANMRATAFLGLYGIIKQAKPLDKAFAPMHSIWEPNEVWADFIAKIIYKNNNLQALQ